MQIKDKRPKVNKAVGDSFLTIPDKQTTKQKSALAKIRKLLRYDLA